MTKDFDYEVSSAQPGKQTSKWYLTGTPGDTLTELQALYPNQWRTLATGFRRRNSGYAAISRIRNGRSSEWRDWPQSLEQGDVELRTVPSPEQEGEWWIIARWVGREIGARL